MFDVCALGDAIVDFKPVKSIKGSDCMEPNPGGTIANMLCACSVMGLKSAFLGKVGNEFFGRFMAEALCQYGVDTKGLKYDDQVHTTLAFVHLDSRGDRSFSFYRHPGADFMLRAEEVDTSIIAQSKIFHFSAMALTDEPARSACRKALKTALQNGLVISCDVNYRNNLWKDLEMAKSVILDFLAYVDILKASEEELTLLTGTCDVVSAADAVYGMYANPLIVATLGPKGCYYRHNDITGRLSTYDAKAVDTTGAGDAFVGGMLYKYLEAGKVVSEFSNDEIVEMLDFANATGALSVSSLGSMSSMPNKDEVEAFKKTAKRVGE